MERDVLYNAAQQAATWPERLERAARSGFVPFLTKRFTIAIPIIASVLLVIVLVNMLRTTCSDPGILPRATRDEVECLEKSYENSSASRPPPRTKDIIVKGQTVKSKYCFTCKMFRPPRASHCSICDNCVDRFDHHCPFLGNCIGRRNYKSFYFFVVSLSLLAVFILALAIAHLAILSKERGNFLEALKESPTSAVVVLISFFGMWTVLGLAGFHTYLICVEQTTNEDIKGLFGKPNSNPYSRGSTVQNCCFLLCGPIPPSLIDPRGRVTSDFLRGLPKPSALNLTQPQPQTTIPIRPNSSISTGSLSPHCREYPGTSYVSGTKQTVVATRNAAHSPEDMNNPVPRTTGYPPVRTGQQPQTKFQNTTNGNGNMSIRPATTPNSSHTSTATGGGVGATTNIVPKSGTFPDSTRIEREKGVPGTAAARSEDKSYRVGSNYYNANSSQETLSSSESNYNRSSGSGVVLELNEPVHNNRTRAGRPCRTGEDRDRQSKDLDHLTMINSPLHLDSIL